MKHQRKHFTVQVLQPSLNRATNNPLKSYEIKILNDWYFHCRFECYTEGTADSPYDYVYVKVTTVRSLRSARPQVCILTFSSLCLSIEDYGQ